MRDVKCNPDYIREDVWVNALDDVRNTVMRNLWVKVCRGVKANIETDVEDTIRRNVDRSVKVNVMDISVSIGTLNGKYTGV